MIWRDNDKAGAEYEQVAKVLMALGCQVSAIDVTGLVEIDGGNRTTDRKTEGWDAADTIDEWVDTRPCAKPRSRRGFQGRTKHIRPT
jgi:hypothetical protein